MTIRRHLLELRPGIARQIFHLSLAMVASIAFLPLVHGNVTGEGDVSPVGPTLLPIGGGVATDVIVGDTGAGRLTIDAPAFTDPLSSPTGIIGNTASGIGQVSIAGFDLDQSAWEVDTTLTVGLAGLGILDLSSGGLVSVGNDSMTPGIFDMGEIIVGDALFSQGIVNVSGFATTMETQTMTIGNFGFATLDVSNRGTLRSEFTRIGNEPDSIGRVTLTGLGTRWINSGTTSDDFVVGYEGRGTLEIFDQALATAAEDVIVGRDGGSRGTVRVSGQGSLWLIDDGSGSGGEDLDIGTNGVGEISISAGGMIRASGTTTVGATSFVNLATGGVLNSGGVTLNGVIRGDGRIESGITIGSSGELRNAAGASGLRERLLVTGEVTNGGTIESLGGEMEFESVVTNNFEIVARDAVMRFNGGLTNSGSLTLGGDTTLHGTVSGGLLTVLSGSSPLLVGDLQFTSGILALSIGGEPGIFDITGEANLSGAVFDLNYLGAAAPQFGDSYQLLQAGGGIMGAFPTSASDGTNIWDITNPGGGSALFATFNGVGANPMGADFNGDGVVDGLDMATWKANFPIASGATIDLGDADGDGDVDSFDFLKIQRDFGVIPVPPLVGGAVPEPTSIALLVLGGVLALGRRSRGAV